jgi:hypothetical protein
MIIRELFVRLGLDADAASFAEGFAAVELLKGGIEGLVDLVKETVVGFAEQIKKTAEAGDHMKKLAQSTGIGAETLQKLGYAADLADVGTEELATSLFHLARTGVKDVQGEILKLADRFHTMKDGGEKTKIAMEKFGRAGARMIPFLNQGRVAISELMKEAEDLGIVMGEEDLNASEEFNDSMKTLGYAFVGFRNAAILPLLKPLSQLIKSFTGFVKQMKSAIPTLRTLTMWIKTGAIVAISALTIALLANQAAVASTVGWYAALGVGAVVAAVKAAAAWLAVVGPLVLAAAGLAFILLVFEDLITYFQGGQSVIGDMIGGWKSLFVDFKEFLGYFVAWIIDRFVRLQTWVFSLFGGWGEKLGDTIMTGIKKAIAFLPGGASFVSKFFPDTATNPAAGASSSVAASPTAKTTNNSFKADFTVNASPGQNPQEVANTVRTTLEEFHNDRLREAAAGVQ